MTYWMSVSVISHIATQLAVLHCVTQTREYLLIKQV